MIAATSSRVPISVITRIFSRKAPVRSLISMVVTSRTIVIGSSPQAARENEKNTPSARITSPMMRNGAALSVPVRSPYIR